MKYDYLYKVREGVAAVTFNLKERYSKKQEEVLPILSS